MHKSHQYCKHLARLLRAREVPHSHSAHQEAVLELSAAETQPEAFYLLG